MSRRSAVVNVEAECARMFSRSMPKYTESAPACMAAASDSCEPTGAMISKSCMLAFIISCLLSYSCPASTISTTRSVSRSVPSGSYCFFRLAPNAQANACQKPARTGPRKAWMAS